MRVPFRVVIATAAVAVVAVAIPLVLRVDQVPEPSVVAAADEPPPARPPAPVHRRAAPQPAEPVAPAEPTDRAFVVRVTDADGAPAPGVRVRLDAAQNDDFVESATDAEGRASFRVAGPVRSADVLPRGADGRAWRVREAAPPAPESDGCLRVVEPADWVSGVVRGDAAEPLPGHEVVAVRGGRVVARALADADGRFELAVPRGATVDVTVTGLSRAWWDDTWRNTPTARVRSGIERWRQLDGDVAGIVAPRDGVDVVCHRPTSDETSTLRVRVVAPDGTPVAGVPIHVDRGVVLTGDEPSAAESGADGIAELREIPRRRVTILVMPAPRAPRPWEALGLAAPGERPYVRGDSGEVTLALVRGVAVAGRVEIPESFVSRGAGAAPGTFGPFGALVSVATRSGSALGSGRTDEHGAFRFLVPDAGGDPVRITASAAGADGVAWRAAIDGACGEGLLLRLARDVPESDVASHLRAAGPAAPK